MLIQFLQLELFINLVVKRIELLVRITVNLVNCVLLLLLYLLQLLLIVCVYVLQLDLKLLLLRVDFAHFVAKVTFNVLKVLGVLIIELCKLFLKGNSLLLCQINIVVDLIF